MKEVIAKFYPDSPRSMYLASCPTCGQTARLRLSNMLMKENGRDTCGHFLGYKAAGEVVTFRFELKQPR